MGERVLEPLGDLGRYALEFGYGDVYDRPGLPLRDRMLLTIALLTAAGRAAQLRVHMRSALRVGVSVRELEEVVIHTVPYIGFPLAIDAMVLLGEVTAEVG